MKVHIASAVLSILLDMTTKFNAVSLSSAKFGHKLPLLRLLIDVANTLKHACSNLKQAMSNTDANKCCTQSEEGDTVFEYLVREDNAEWQHWRECVPSWKYPKEQERPKFAQLIIPTLDSVRYEKLLTLAYSVQKVIKCMFVNSAVLLHCLAAVPQQRPKCYSKHACCSN